jgi:hypothetical protein
MPRLVLLLLAMGCRVTDDPKVPVGPEDDPVLDTDVDTDTDTDDTDVVPAPTCGDVCFTWAAPESPPPPVRGEAVSHDHLDCNPEGAKPEQCPDGYTCDGLVETPLGDPGLGARRVCVPNDAPPPLSIDLHPPMPDGVDVTLSFQFADGAWRRGDHAGWVVLLGRDSDVYVRRPIPVDADGLLPLTLPLGAYDVHFVMPYDVDAAYPKLVQDGVLTVAGPGTGVIDTETEEVLFDVLVDGVRSPAGCPAQYGVFLKGEHTPRHALYLRNGAWQTLPLRPDTYDMVLEPPWGSCGLPKQRVVLEDAVVLRPGDDTVAVDFRTATVDGQVTLNGQPWGGDGVQLLLRTGESTQELHPIADDGTFSVLVWRDTPYEVAVLNVDESAPQGQLVVHEDLRFDGSPLSLDLTTRTVSGTLTELAGEPPRGNRGEVLQYVGGRPSARLPVTRSGPATWGGEIWDLPGILVLDGRRLASAVLFDGTAPDVVDADLAPRADVTFVLDVDGLPAETVFPNAGHTAWLNLYPVDLQDELVFGFDARYDTLHVQASFPAGELVTTAEVSPGRYAVIGGIWDVFGTVGTNHDFGLVDIVADTTVPLRLDSTTLEVEILHGGQPLAAPAVVYLSGTRGQQPRQGRVTLRSIGGVIQEVGVACNTGAVCPNVLGYTQVWTNLDL